MKNEKNQPIHIWIDDGFPINKIIKKLSARLFDIDEESNAILAVIAKDGPSTEYQLQKKGCKISHYVSREKVRYRLRNGGFLQNFVFSREGGIHRNTGNNVRFYYLNLRGFLASLAKTEFEENYLVKRYHKFLSNFTRVPIIPEISVQIVKYGLALFLFENMMNGTKLTDNQIMKKLLFEFFDPLHPLGMPSTPYQKINDHKLENYLTSIRQRYHVSQLVLIELYKMASKEISYSNKKYDYLTFLDLIKYWYHYFEEINFRSTKNYDPFLESYPTYAEGVVLEHEPIYQRANQIFKSLGLRPLKYKWMPTLWDIEITR